MGAFGSFGGQQIRVRFRIAAIAARAVVALALIASVAAGASAEEVAKPGLSFTETADSLLRKRPQEPIPPYPYRQEEVVVRNEAAGVALAGTLTLPDAAPPHAAVLLLNGSGAHDRDATTPGKHRPHLILADYLTRRGVATLRLDDRGVGGSTGEYWSATYNDLTEDAAAALNFLASRPEIARDRIAVIGHSEGALVGAKLAARSDHVGLLVLLASPGLTGEEISYPAFEKFAHSSGRSEEWTMQNLRLHRRYYRALIEATDTSAAPRIREILREELARLYEIEQRETGEPRTTEQLERRVERMIWGGFQPRNRMFLMHDPKSVLSRITIPVLAVHGELDMNVEPAPNLAAISSALTSAGNGDVTVVVLPRLNHFFQTAQTGSPREAGELEETFAPAALEVIGDWLARRSSPVPEAKREAALP